MKKDVTKFSISAALFIAAIASFAFQEPDQEEVPKKQPLVIKGSSIAKQFSDSLTMARREFDKELRRNDSLWEERVKNYKSLEKNVDDLKEANRLQKRAIGKLVQILTNFPADSTLNRFNLEEKSINTDSLKKKINLPEVEIPQPKRRGFFKRIFSKE